MSVDAGRGGTKGGTEKVRSFVTFFRDGFPEADKVKNTYQWPPSDPSIDAMLGGLTFNGEILKVKNLMGAPSNPIPLVKRSSEQFLFLKLDIWKALM